MSPPLSPDDRALIIKALDTHASAMRALYGSVMPRMSKFKAEAAHSRQLANRFRKES